MIKAHRWEEVFQAYIFGNDMGFQKKKIIKMVRFP